MYAFAVFLTHVQYWVDYNVLDLITTKSTYIHAWNQNFKMSLNKASGGTYVFQIIRWIRLDLKEPQND